MFSTHAAQDSFYPSHALADATNRLPTEMANGNKQDHYRTPCGDHRQQQYPAAPYPPLPMTAPTVTEVIYLPLPAGHTLTSPQLVADYSSPTGLHRQQSPPPPLPPPPPPPPPPPLPRFSSCDNFSTPPAPPAPYPPFPPSRAVTPPSLKHEYLVGTPPAALETPLPSPEAPPSRPQLVADYHSLAAASWAVRYQSSSPPLPPLPPSPPQLPAAAATEQLNDRRRPSNDNWLPGRQDPPCLPGQAILPCQGAAAACSALAHEFRDSLQQEQQRALKCSDTADGQDIDEPPSSPPLRQLAATSRKAERIQGQNTTKVIQPVYKGNGEKSSSSSSCRSEKGGCTKGRSINRSAGGGGGGRSGGRTSSDDAYVIPKKKEYLGCRGSSKDNVCVTHPNSGSSCQGQQADRHERSRHSNWDREIGPGRNSSRSSPCEDEDDYCHSNSSSFSATGRGGHDGGGGGLRWSERDNGRYYHRDRTYDRASGGGSGRRAQDDDAIGGRYRRGGDGRFGGDGREKHRPRCDGDCTAVDRVVNAGRGRARYGSSGREHEEDGRRGDRGGGGSGGPRKWSGKSCPPPSAEKRRDTSVRSAAAAATAAPVPSPEIEGDDVLAELTTQLTALELDSCKDGVAGNAKAPGCAGTAYLTLEKYKEASAAGAIKAYKGTKYQTVDDRYADGWAFNPTTSRWIKVACQEKKDAIEALPALLARLQLMESRDKLATQRSQLMETKLEKIAKANKTGRSTESLSVPTAPVLVVFDTNWLIHNLADTMFRVEDIVSGNKDTSVLIPNEVLSELDRLKSRGKDEGTRSSARKANRYFRGLLESPGVSGREFPVVRVQDSTERFRDSGDHSRPENLRGDDSILNCCMFFTKGIDTPRKVILVTGDNNFAIRARLHGLITTGRPLCSAHPRPSSFSRGY